MKRVIILALCAIGMSSCFTQTYIKPEKIDYANNAFLFSSNATLKEAYDITMLVVNANTWNQATGDGQTMLEDRFFPRSKVRSGSDNTIEITHFSQNNHQLNFTIKTGGKNINEVGAEWQVVYDNKFTYTITQIADNRWTLKGGADYSSLDMTVSAQFSSIDPIAFTLEGSTQWLVPSYWQAETLNTITQPLEYSIIAPHFDYSYEYGYSNVLIPSSGSMQIEFDEQNATVVFNNAAGYTISMLGESKNYTL